MLPLNKKEYKNRAISFLNNLISGNRVFIKYDGQKFDNSKNLLAYVYLQNKTFLNAKLIKNGLAKCDRSMDFYHKSRFIRYENEAKHTKSGVWEKGK
ncbi:MAG: thermonuclease family protein [Planctomycetota bacterium]